MSILPLTYAMEIAIAMNSLDIEVVDTIYTKTGGQDVQSVIPSATGDIITTRTIEAAVDCSNHKQLEIIFGGSVSEGDIGIYTMSELFTDDTYEYATESSSRKQSFIRFFGQMFRVLGANNWTAQGGYYMYLGRRHATQDLI